MTQERYLEEAVRERKGPSPADEASPPRKPGDATEAGEDGIEQQTDEQPADEHAEHAEPQQPRPA